MVLSRRTLATRPVMGLLVLAGMGALCLWSYMFSFQNKVISFGTGLPFCGALMVWSWYEIMRLRRRRLGRWMWWSVAMMMLFSVAPSLLLLGGSGEMFIPSKDRVGYAAAVTAVEVVLVLLWTRFLARDITWLDCEEMFRNKSLGCLLVSALLFWNVILTMVICSLWFWLIFMFVAVALNDTLSYGIGTLAGRRRCFRYSPDKTLEGFLAGAVLVYGLMIVFWFCSPETVRDRFLGSGVGRFGCLYAAVPAMLVLWSCDFGDLQFSMHKRIFRIKDYSGLLGAHGGFWDRFDSHCFAFILWGIFALVWYALLPSPPAA